MTDTKSTTNAEPVKSELDQVAGALRDQLKDGVKGWVGRRALELVARLLKSQTTKHEDGTLSIRFGGSEEGRPYLEFFDLADDDQKIGVGMGTSGGYDRREIMIPTGDIFGGLD